MGFVEDIKQKAEELGEKAGDVFEAAKDKAGDLVEAARDKLDADDDGDVDSADAAKAFEDVKSTVSGGPDSAPEPVAAPENASPVETTSPVDTASPAEAVAAPATDTVADQAPDAAEAARDEALADVQAKAEDLQSDNG